MDPTPAQPEFATSVSQLARILGKTRQTLYNWRDDLPGCPELPSEGHKVAIAPWIEFAQRHGKSAPDEDEEVIKSKFVYEALDKKAQAETRAFKLKVLREQYTPNDVIAADLQRFDAELIALVTHAFEEVIPERGANKSAAELREVCRDALDGFMRRLHAGSAEVVGKFPTPQS